MAHITATHPILPNSCPYSENDLNTRFRCKPTYKIFTLDELITMTCARDV